MSYKEDVQAVYKKFKRGGIIESDFEMRTLKRWALVGFTTLGADFELKRATAKLTKRGRWKVPVLISNL